MDSWFRCTNTYGTCGVCVTSVSGWPRFYSIVADPTATVDDGSCIAIVYGCTDATAYTTMLVLM